MTSWQPAFSRAAIACSSGYASRVRIRVSVTDPAAIDSGLPLKVPEVGDPCRATGDRRVVEAGPTRRVGAPLPAAAR